MDIQIATQISSNTLNHIIQNTQNIIRIKQLCKNQLPSKCTQQTHSLLIQNFHNALQLTQQQPYVQNNVHLIQNMKTDNRMPMKLKFQKYNHIPQFLNQRLSFDAKSFRKSSAIKSRRDQRTASTSHRKRLDAFSKTYNQSFLQQNRPWTQTQCRKKFSKTADSSSKNKYFQLKDQNDSMSIEDQIKRKQLKQKHAKQKAQNQKIQNAFMKLSYQRRALQEELQSAKLADKKNTYNKNNKINEIISFQTQNGSVLTNKFKKPFRKTIQNIIKLEYDQRTRDRILKRKSQKQYEIESPKKKRDQDQENQREKFIQNNSNYSNGGRRQISLIPYVTINPGISLSQSTIQASISRSRPTGQLTKQKYFASIQNKTFRSYSRQISPQRIDKKLMTIDVCQKNRVSRSTLNNQTKDSFRKSILWAPRTSRGSHRIKLEKEDFLRQFID